MEPGHPTRHRHHRDQLPENHLRTLPGTRTVHHLPHPAPPAHRAPPGRARRSTRRPRRPRHQPWQATYTLRAGVEGTIHQAVTVCDIRHARYRSLRKVHLQQVFSAVALNLIRLHAYWHDHPTDRTRTSHLARLELTLAA